MVVNFAGVEASHHSFVMRDVWYQESSVRINVKMLVCTRGSSNNGWMRMYLPFDRMLVSEMDPNCYLIIEDK